MDIRRRSRIEIRCAEKDASPKNCQSFEAYRGRNAAKGIQHGIVPRFAGLNSTGYFALATKKPITRVGRFALSGLLWRSNPANVQPTWVTRCWASDSMTVRSVVREEPRAFTPYNASGGYLFLGCDFAGR
jgi:hypothetical protein